MKRQIDDKTILEKFAEDFCKVVETSEFHSSVTSGLIHSWNSDSDQEPLEEWHLHATSL